MKKFIKNSPLFFGAIIGALFPVAFFILCLISLFIPSFIFIRILIAIIGFVENVQNYTNIELTYREPGFHLFSIPSLSLYGFLFIWLICIMVGIFIGMCYKIYSQGTHKSKNI